MNIENILKEGISILQKNKIANPQLDSEILLSNSIKRDKKHTDLVSVRASEWTFSFVLDISTSITNSYHLKSNDIRFVSDRFCLSTKCISYRLLFSWMLISMNFDKWGPMCRLRIRKEENESQWYPW